MGSLVSPLGVSPFPVLFSSFTSQHSNVETSQFAILIGARTCRLRQLLLLLCEEKFSELDDVQAF